MLDFSIKRVTDHVYVILEYGYKDQSHDALKLIFSFTFALLNGF